MAVQRLSLLTLPRERWRNGAGWTRAVQQEGEGDGLLWRVSLAEINQAAPFSIFEGLDRTTVLVKGGPVQLGDDTQHWVLSEPGDMASYPGELALANARPGADALFWNVMVRRGLARSCVCVHGHKPVTLPTDGHSLIWVMRGAYELSGAALTESEHIGSDEGLHWAASQGDAASLSLHPMASDALLLHTHVVC